MKRRPYELAEEARRHMEERAVERRRAARESAVDPDVYVGRHGGLVHPRSESAVLDHAVMNLQRIHGQCSCDRPLLTAIIRDLQRLRRQVGEGYHRNPSGLVLYGGNPPLRTRRIDGGATRVRGVISTDVHAIQYRHAEDRKNYEHVFDHPTHMIAVEHGGIRDVVLSSPDMLPLWDDF